MNVNESLARLGCTPFSTSAAYAVGLTDADLQRLCACRLIRRLVKGIYVAAGVPDSLELRCLALRLVVPPEAVVVDRTAGWLHGAPMILAPNDDLEVPAVSVFHRARGGRLRNPLSLSGQRMMPDSDVMDLHGIVVTTPVRTTLDLGRLQRRDGAFAGMDMMLRLGVPHGEVLRRVEEFAGCRGVRQLRVLAPLADARSQSPGESVLRLRWIDCADLPRPELQLPVARAGLAPYFLDLALQELRFAAEYDGLAWHGPEREGHDDERREWMEEVRGWHIVVFARSDVFGQHQCAEVKLRDGIREARRRIRSTRPAA